MLHDADRNRSYEVAIRECIEEFIETEGYAPTVLDVGCGTGMLTAIALGTSAARVIALDVNETMVELAQMCRLASRGLPQSHRGVRRGK